MKREPIKNDNPPTPGEHSELETLVAKPQNAKKAVRMSSIKNQSSAEGETGGKGRILAALRRSPLVGAELNLARLRTKGRNIEF